MNPPDHPDPLSSTALFLVSLRQSLAKGRPQPPARPPGQLPRPPQAPVVRLVHIGTLLAHGYAVGVLCRNDTLKSVQFS